MHTNSRLLFEKYAKSLLNSGMKVLEIGPDEFPSTYQKLVNNPLIDWNTLDIYDSPSLTYSKSDEYSFNIPNNSYDVVLSGQVIEHVRKPWVWVKELVRVTKQNGLVITINPVSWVYHEAPIDCWRIYPEGMKALYEEAGLTVLKSTWESLETPNYKKGIPGVSLEWQSRKKRIMSMVFGRFGFTVERSYDTITIGKKDVSVKQRAAANK